MHLYPWQKKALSKSGSSLWVCEVGTGKTFAADLWLNEGERSSRPLILCPKQIRAQWQEKRDCPVLTPQTILKEGLPDKPTAIVVDEADLFAAPLFIAQKRSKCAEKLYHYIKDNPQADVLLLTATPVRSTPWNMHTLLTYIGRYIDHKEYQQEYFELEFKPYLPRPAWMPKRGWQTMMQDLIEKNATVALMKDMVDYLPPETYEVIKLKPPKYEDNEEWEATKQFVEDHRLEQLSKPKEVQKIARNFRKVVVVTHYREQIDDLYKKLSRERTTYVLCGGVKNMEQIISDAENDPECYFLVQNSIAAGFELPSFSCMIFTSQSYGARNYVQCKARIRRINALKPVIYYFLQGGRCDELVYNSVMDGRDFIPSEYRKYQ